MVSEYAIEDIERMRAEGLRPTPRDIIRLNALGYAADHAADAPSSLHLPLLVFMPRDSWFHLPLVLREPTLRHEQWIERVLGYVGFEDDFAVYSVYGFALSRRAEKLPDETRHLAVIRAVGRFSRRLMRFTRSQLFGAVDFLLFGRDANAGEVSARKATGETADPGSPTVGLLTERLAWRLPIPLDDALRMTRSELRAAIELAMGNDERIDKKATHAAALGRYALTRDEIRSRLESKSRGSKER